MGEIKSTLDLVLEKTKNLTLSSEEKESQKQKEIENRIKFNSPKSIIMESIFKALKFLYDIYGKWTISCVNYFGGSRATILDIALWIYMEWNEKFGISF